MHNKKKKILFTIPNFDTAGTGKAMMKIIERLDTTEFEPHIACNHDRGDFFNVVKKSGFPIHIVPTTTSMKKKIKGIIECWKMSKFYRQHGFDLVHSFHYSDDYSEALSVRMAGKKWVYVKKNMNWGGNGWKLRTWLANGVLVQNPTMMEKFFPSNRKATLCFRGVDTSEFFPQPPQEYLMKEFGITPSTKVILLVANLVPLKGVDLLFEAMQNIKVSKAEDIRIFIVGDDRSEYAQNLKTLAKDLDFPVIFTGKRMDVSAFHSIATLFVFPSLKEGFGVSLLESLASGTYSIGSDIPGIKDQLKDFPDQLFPKGDIVQFAKKIQVALNFSEEELKERVKKQLEVINNGMRIEDEVARHEEFYRKILSMR